MRRRGAIEYTTEYFGKIGTITVEVGAGETQSALSMMDAPRDGVDDCFHWLTLLSGGDRGYDVTRRTAYRLIPWDRTKDRKQYFYKDAPCRIPCRAHLSYTNNILLTEKNNYRRRQPYIQIPSVLSAAGSIGVGRSICKVKVLLSSVMESVPPYCSAIYFMFLMP